MAKKQTPDGLPVVDEGTLMEFLRQYNIASPDNDPELTQRIEGENPQIYRMLRLGMEGAPTHVAMLYFEAGMQIAYDLLRIQSGKDKSEA